MWVSVRLWREVGAGCGLLGMSLAVMGARRVVLTDHPDAMPLLRRNVERNANVLLGDAKRQKKEERKGRKRREGGDGNGEGGGEGEGEGEGEGDGKGKGEGKNESGRGERDRKPSPSRTLNPAASHPAPSSAPASNRLHVVSPPVSPAVTTTCMPLDWEDQSHLDAVAALGPFDLVLATDVVFNVRLVDPLLRCMQAGRREGGGEEGSCTIIKRTMKNIRRLRNQCFTEPLWFRV
jgi:hypothetical protein